MHQGRNTKSEMRAETSACVHTIRASEQRLQFQQILRGAVLSHGKLKRPSSTVANPRAREARYRCRRARSEAACLGERRASGLDLDQDLDQGSEANDEQVQA